MGNFAICHYSRLRVEPGGVRLQYVLDFAEIPAFGEKNRMDADKDGTISAAEQNDYLAKKGEELRVAISLKHDGIALPFRLLTSTLRLEPGAGGLETVRLEYDFVAALPDLSNAPSRFQYRDDNYPSRAGWKEIIVLNSDGVALLASTVGTQDRSRALSNYPADQIPPQDVQASFTVSLDTQSRGRVEQDSPQESSASKTPRDAFTDVILNEDVGVTAMGLGLAIAFVFGSLHALAPGHGKTMVAAYLAGSRGTAKHAVALGIVVTVTHTLGVFLLGFTVLSLNQFVVPETLYPWVGVASGFIIFCVGIWLLYFRVRRLIRGPKRRLAPSSNISPAHHNHDLPEGPITVRAVLALGISGGLIPCPSALVVLLSAIAVHRLVYGLLLITAFSVGLASVLVVIGLFVVWAKDWIERIPRSYRFLRLLGFLSALVIIALGLNIVVRSLQTIVDF